MRLKNKKTGKTINVQKLELNNGGIDLTYTIEQKTSYGSLAALNEDWEEDKEDIKRKMVASDTDSMGVVHNYRIRKLTPKECWRLMGFDDEDFEKAAQVNSNTQLYKQAGNSIVVNVLEAIFGNLLKGA